MAKVTPNPTTPTATYTAPKPVNTVVAKSNEQQSFMFHKMNYQIMIAGIVLIALGFILMAGGRSEDPNVFDPKEIYSFRRITLAPILVMLGFIVEIIAIMWMPKESVES
jgi:uncharacterized membrane protein